MTTPHAPTKYLGPNQYLGVVVVRNRPPTGADYRQPETGKYYPIGCVWQVGANPTSGTEGDLYMLSKIVANVATWIFLESGTMNVNSFVTNIAGPVEPTSGGVINVNASVSTFTDGTVANTIKTEVQGTNHQIFVGRGTNVAATTITAGGQGTVLVYNTVGSDPVFSTTVNGDGSFTFEGITAGTSRNLIVDHPSTSNTSSSAILGASTRGGGGNPYVGATISATRFFANSINQSSSNTWELRTAANSNFVGGTILQTMTVDGQQNLPLQSSFSAQLSASQSDATGDGTVATMICNSEFYDQNSEYNTSTGVFTAKQTGRYQFNITLALGDLADVHTLGGLFLTVGTAPIAICLWKGNPGAMRDSNNNLIVSGSCLLTMVATNTATVTVQVSGGTKVVDLVGNPSNTPIYCAFSATMIA